MKNFEIFRYIKKWRYLIVLICIAGAVLVYQYAMAKQVYTAQTVLSYSNSEAKSGMTPSGDVLDVNEIYSSKVITGVLEDLSLTTGADSIRSRCSVEPIISEDEEARKEAILKEGEEYVYYPTDYLITFGVDSDYSQEYAATVLDSILENYFINYGEKYINQTVLPNNASNIESGEYDYIECAEILDSSATEIYNYLYDKKFHYPDYRSATTGYTFTDLYNMYKEDLNYNIPELYSKILNQKVSKDQSVLIKDYSNKISQYNIDLANMKEKIDPLYDLITGYSLKSKEGIQYHYGKGTESDNTNDYILKDVYDEHTEGEEIKRINTETTYDALINNYVSLEVKRQYTQVDMEHKQNLLSIFRDAVPPADQDAAIAEIEEDMAALIKRLDENYKIVEATVDEFNQYLGASNITTLTSINVSEKININLYLILALFVFLVCGCLGAIVLGRTQDFVEYLLYKDRKTGLDNRAKCDMLINRYAEKPLSDNFAFILIRLDVLKMVNSQVGRNAGDVLLGEFGRILGEIARDYGSACYNGSDQFMCFFENCSYKKAEMFIESLSSYVEHYNAQGPEHNITFSYAIEETKETGIYDARGLISASFRDINAKSAEASKPDNDGGDDDNGAPGGKPVYKEESKQETAKSAPVALAGVDNGAMNSHDIIKMVTEAVAAGMRLGSEKAEPPKAQPEAEPQEETPPPQGKPPYEPISWSSESSVPKRRYTAVTKTSAEKPKKAEEQELPLEEVEVSVKDTGKKGKTAAKKNSSEPQVDFNPYAPKPRVKKSYRTRGDAADLGPYAPKNRNDK